MLGMSVSGKIDYHSATQGIQNLHVIRYLLPALDLSKMMMADRLAAKLHTSQFTKKPIYSQKERQGSIFLNIAKA